MTPQGMSPAGDGQFSLKIPTYPNHEDRISQRKDVRDSLDFTHSLNGLKHRHANFGSGEIIPIIALSNLLGDLQLSDVCSWPLKQSTTTQLQRRNHTI